MGLRMALIPDYGLRLKTDGHDNPHVNHLFYAVPIYGFDTLGYPGRYTVTVNTIYDGETHCLSLDFGWAVLTKILDKLPPKIRDEIKSQLNHAPHIQNQFVFPYPIYCDSVAATLGEVQQAAQESFIPFLVRDVKISSRIHLDQNSD